MSELFTQGSVGGAAGNCCFYPAVRFLRRKAFRKHSRNRVLERREKTKETKGIVPDISFRCYVLV